MTSFSTHTIAGIESLGEKLRRLRDEARLSLPQLAKESGIQPKYLEALEAGRYDQLPGDVYVRNFLRQYADALHVRFDRIVELYERERGLVPNVGPSARPPRALTEAHALSLHSLLKYIGLGGAALVLIVYLAFTLHRVVTPPSLSVSSPTQSLVTHELRLTVAGQTEKESQVHINGQEVFTDPDGKFSEPVDLQPGLNVIKISSKKPRSREQVLYRQVQVTLQTGPADGQS